ncbi:hypothetical protein, partial [Collinsella aerofaciens]|uniref:hypothetical protein n=1 Tax=Collinsella aerofaciens TaxID=74426 RepID=UPI00325B2083
MTENYNPNSAIAIGSGWWERSVFPNASKGFLHVDSSGNPSDSNSAPGWFCVSPPRVLSFGDRTDGFR